MWTPKRILLLTLGIVLFLASYLFYGNYLSGVDGLPPLPEQYWPRPHTAEPVTPRKPIKTDLVKKLEEAFGKDCPEAKRPIKIEVQARGLILAAREFEILPDDGRVRLCPLSVAIFAMARGAEDAAPEVNTVRGDEAYLVFERPIKTVADMSKYRIVAGQLAGNIRIVNNRRTPQRADDLFVNINKGPLYYNQKTQRIWTDDYVHLEDWQSSPGPTKIRGQGMELALVAEPPGGRRGAPAPARRQQFDNITGVERVKLHAAVDMHLYVDARSGFLNSASGPRPPAAGAGAAPPGGGGKPAAEKARLTIKTHGPFEYDLVKDFARFDVPARRGGLQDCVEVIRVHEVPDNPKASKQETLQCDHLELQFRRKEAAPAPAGQAPRAAAAPRAAPGERSLSLQIETAHAHGKGAYSVLLTSDAEDLEAQGCDLFYDARTLCTTLKGTPRDGMVAIKEGNSFEASELQIRTNKERQGQEATALGPGRLSLFEKGESRLVARWEDKLVSTKEGDHDVLHLTGKAAFNDTENQQELHADDLVVWLKPNAPRPEGAPPVRPGPGKSPPGARGAGSRRPHHLVASGHVVARSREFNIREAQRFVVWFKDAPPPPVPGPSVAPGVPGATAKRPAAPDKGQQTTDKGAKQPIDLTARSVEAHVRRVGERSQLELLNSEGAVHVTQAPSKPGGRGVDIRGETLQMTAHPDGNLLVVRTAPRSDATNDDLAQLEMDRLLILGPEINVDQRTNEAWVNGMGAMTVESDSDFQGNKLKRPAPLTVYWNKSMFFNGKSAEFDGDVVAEQAKGGGGSAGRPGTPAAPEEQDKAVLACHVLQVYFDRPISLKEGERGGERSKVDRLVCSGAVRIEDGAFEGGAKVKSQRLCGSGVTYDNVEETVRTSGPGLFRLFQRGGASPGLGEGRGRAPVKDRKGAAGDDELKLTYVTFQNQMCGDRKTNVAFFYGNVRVLHTPCTDPDEEIDVDQLFERKLPRGYMLMRCDKLEVRSRPREKGKPYQDMKASGRVTVRSDNFSGEAAQVSYDEEKDQVIFDGGGGLAVLYKVTRPGERPQKIEGEKIFYRRSSGEHWGKGIRNLEGQ